MSVGAMSEQSFHHLHIADLRRFVKRGPSAFLPSIRVCAVFNQNANDLAAVSGGGAVQGSDFHLVLSCRGNICAAFDQNSRNLRPIEECREMQGSKSVCGPLPGALRILAQNFGKPIRFPCGGGFKNIELRFCREK